MLIISKYHDYYDTSIGIGGIDKTIVYNRSPRFFSTNLDRQIPNDWESSFKVPVDIEKIDSLSMAKFRGSWYGIPSFIPWNSIDEQVLFFLIGFCGKTYLGYSYTKNSQTDFYFGEE